MTTAIVFPGQASQYPRMGEKLLMEFPELKKYYDYASDILNRDIYRQIFTDKAEFLRSKKDIQPAVFVTSYVYYQYLKKKVSIQPRYFAGHSLGEITALVASGMLSFEEGIKLVQKRSELMITATREQQTSMLSVSKIDEMMIQQYCEKKEDIFAACNNSKTQVVVAGTENAINDAFDYFSKLGAKVRRLDTTGASHTPFMKQAAKELEGYLSKVQFHEPSVPVLANVTAKPYARHEDIRKLLMYQLIRPVQWEKIVSYMEQHYVEEMIECGPGSTLTNLLRNRSNKLKAYSIDQDAVVKIRKNHGVSKISHDLITLCKSCVVCCRNRSDEYNVSLCEELYEKFDTIKLEHGCIYDSKEIEQAFHYVREILSNKGYLEIEIQQKCQNICDKLGILME